MKTSKLLLALIALLMGAFAAAPAFAHGRARVSLGFHFGVPVGGYYYPGPFYRPHYYPYYAPAVVYQAPPEPVYVERSSSEAAPQAGYWYYCADARGYYPYVKECPAGWQRVAPTPQN